MRSSTNARHQPPPHTAPGDPDPSPTATAHRPGRPRPIANRHRTPPHATQTHRQPPTHTARPDRDPSPTATAHPPPMGARIKLVSIPAPQATPTHRWALRTCASCNPCPTTGVWRQHLAMGCGTAGRAHGLPFFVASLGDRDANAAAAEAVLTLVDGAAEGAEGQACGDAALNQRALVGVRAVALDARDAADIANAASTCDAGALFAEETVRAPCAEPL
jgi:hypothetical protein